MRAPAALEISIFGALFVLTNEYDPVFHALYARLKAQRRQPT
jgi:hypothetical protein